MAKPYMPLMVGDWLKGTRGMRAEAKGVYLGLLLHQFECGFIPNNMEELALIEPEIGKIWVSLKDKFEEFEPGKLRNKKLVEVISFWDKQSKNGKKGGRPKNKNPKQNPNYNPNIKLHNDLDYDNDIDSLNKKENEQKIEIGTPNGHRIIIRAKYAGELPIVIHGSEGIKEFFNADNTLENRLEDIERAGWTDYEGFMKRNPGAFFDDKDHLYNSFRKHHENKKSNGTYRKNTNSAEQLENRTYTDKWE